MSRVSYGDGSGQFGVPAHALAIGEETSRAISTSRRWTDGNTDDLVVVTYSTNWAVQRYRVLGQGNRRFTSKRFVTEFTATSLTVADFQRRPACRM
jgi:hypothetical protein